MADLILALSQLPAKEVLPPFCARCGRAASGVRRVRLKVAQPFPGSDPVSSILGASYDDQRRWHDLRQLFAQGKGVLELPVCWWHRWIMPPAIFVKSLTEREVTVSGLSDKFVAALRGKGWGRTPSASSKK
jgi:hypothetical protein